MIQFIGIIMLSCIIANLMCAGISYLIVKRKLSNIPDWYN